ncbi:class I SAM-dependent methyltransferase [Pedococcus sp. 5OH_020]|uniref:class I SAM-dependent methyltransferase n=1 Tax=Pedococcus sp. 5OH_020 TaxID=2989814 RepID=UPI0022E9E4F7|nr:class I SAM-dependent methyltransferase [Pedococcus sp. 5OH_020]
MRSRALYDNDKDAPATEAEVSGGIYMPKYFETRLAASPSRTRVWQHICTYLERWIAPDAAVLEVGAGWCDFANNVRAGSVVAMDIDRTVERAAAPHVTAVTGDCTDLSRFADGSFDVVFASNLLEHLTRPTATRLLAEARRVLRRDGQLILLQPNFRLNPGGYFDDYTHVAIYTDRSLADYLASDGWTVRAVMPRFLPLTLKSRGSRLTFLVPWYLRSPLKPLAGQMLVVASR